MKIASNTKITNNLFNIIYSQKRQQYRLSRLVGDQSVSQQSRGLLLMLWRVLGSQYTASQVKEVYQGVTKLFPRNLWVLLQALSSMRILSAERGHLPVYCARHVLSFVGVDQVHLVSLLTALRYNADVIHAMLVGQEKYDSADYGVPYSRFLFPAEDIFLFKGWLNSPSIAQLEESYGEMCSLSSTLQWGKNYFPWHQDESGKLGKIPSSLNSLQCDMSDVRQMMRSPEWSLREWRCERAMHKFWCKYAPLLALAVTAIVSIGYIANNSVEISRGNLTQGEHDAYAFGIVLLLFLAVPSICLFGAMLALCPKGFCWTKSFSWAPLLPQGILMKREQARMAEAGMPNSGIQLSDLEAGLLGGQKRKPELHQPKAVVTYLS